MPIRIKSITITPQQTTVGQPVIITALAEDITWENLRNDFVTWGEVRRSFTNWDKVKNYIYSIPNPVPDADCLYCNDGSALFDVDAVQISIRGGNATTRYSGAEIDSFIGEVINNG